MTPSCNNCQPSQHSPRDNPTGYKHVGRCVNSSFRREVDEDCALLGYYATSSGN